MSEKINNIHCFFEQSGTFKNEWKKLGYHAEDYDIQNTYGQTDHQIDLFAEIERAYDNEASIFDNIGTDDLIMAFFPCIYFESMQMTYYDLTCVNYRKCSKKRMYDTLFERIGNRKNFYTLLYKLYAVCDMRGLKLIIENPATIPTYLLFTQNFPRPSIIDRNRTLRGDYFVKPTAYWFVNLQPTYGETYNINTKPKNIKKSKPSELGGGTCSKERSEISPTYARAFILDFILGNKDYAKQLTLF